MLIFCDLRSEAFPRNASENKKCTSLKIKNVVVQIVSQLKHIGYVYTVEGHIPAELWPPGQAVFCINQKYEWIKLYIYGNKYIIVLWWFYWCDSYTKRDLSDYNVETLYLYLVIYGYSGGGGHIYSRAISFWKGVTTFFWSFLPLNMPVFNPFPFFRKSFTSFLERKSLRYSLCWKVYI